MYKYRTSVYYRNPDGTHKTIGITANSRRELERKKQEIKEKEKSGIDLANNSTFGYWSKKWFENTKLNQGLSAHQEDSLKCILKLLNAEFSDVKFRYITMNRFQEFINKLAEENPNTSRPASASYLRKIRNTAQDIAEYADGSRVDGVSAFYRVTIPRNAPVKKRTALTEEQVHYIETFKHPMQLFSMIAAFSGLRRGEILALQWKHIDLDHNKIHVVQSLNWTPNQPKIKSGGKTVNSTRIVIIPPVLVSYLREYKSGLVAYPTSNTPVCEYKGGYFTQSAFRRRWDSYIKEMNLFFGDFSNCDLSKVSVVPMQIEPFTPHECRHFFATLCFLEGLSITETMQELGHADPTTTIAIYTDLKNYHKSDLSSEFRKKVNTSYRIPITGDSSVSMIENNNAG